MTYLSNDDYTAYFSSSSEELVLLIAGMTSLIIHKQGVIQSIKEYPWFHRLSKSVFGKHDITTEELSEQMDQTIGYCLETIASLTVNNKIPDEMFNTLNNALLKMNRSGTIKKEQIISLANGIQSKVSQNESLNTLNSYIDTGIDNESHKIISLAKVIALLDSSITENETSLNEIKTKLKNKGVLDSENILFSEYLINWMKLSELGAARFIICLSLSDDNLSDELTRNLLLSFYSIPLKARKMKNREAIVEDFLNSNQIDLDYSISTYELFEEYVSTLKSLSVMCVEENVSLNENYISGGGSAETSIEQDIKYKGVNEYASLFEYLNSIITELDSFYMICKSWTITASEYKSQVLRDYIHQQMGNLVDVVLRSADTILDTYNNIGKIIEYIRLNHIELIPRNAGIDFDGGIDLSGKYKRSFEDEKERKALYELTEHYLKNFILDQVVPQHLPTFYGVEVDNLKYNFVDAVFDIGSMPFSENWGFLRNYHDYFLQLAEQIKNKVSDGNEYNDLKDIPKRFGRVSFFSDPSVYKSLCKDYDVAKLPYIVISTDNITDNQGLFEVSPWLSEDEPTMVRMALVNFGEEETEYSMEGSWGTEYTFRIIDKKATVWKNESENENIEYLYFEFKKLYTCAIGDTVTFVFENDAYGEIYSSITLV